MHNLKHKLINSVRHSPNSNPPFFTAHLFVALSPPPLEGITRFSLEGTPRSSWREVRKMILASCIFSSVVLVAENSGEGRVRNEHSVDIARDGVHAKQVRPRVPGVDKLWKEFSSPT
jgi:hypothetical protein